jgi:hypothetical protein
MQATITTTMADLGIMAQQDLQSQQTATQAPVTPVLKTVGSGSTISKTSGPSYINSTQSNAIFWRPALPAGLVRLSYGRMTSG